MTDESARQRRLLDAQIERWTSDARKLSEQGKDAAALDLYRRAADQLPGAPWLQHRTSECARKLQQPELAIAYARRAATAFQLADFPKRAVAPLRSAWALASDGLPGSSKVLIDVAIELIQVHKRLGLSADAAVTFERTNAVLRARGFAELGRQALESEPPQSRVTPAKAAPSGRRESAPAAALAPRAASAPWRAR